MEQGGCMAVLHLGVEPNLFGEKSVLKDLEKLSDEWHVFYSLGFVDRNGFDRQREIDFVALHKKFGLVFIEVKGGTVKFENGLVRQWLDNQWKDRNPIQQLNAARRVCLEYLASRGVAGFIPARNLYVFPTTERPSSGLSQELSECSFFGDESISLAAHVADVVATDQTLTGDVQKIIELLTPCLTYDVTDSDGETAGAETHRKHQSLLEIMAGGGGTFGNVEIAKAALGAHREALQALWYRVVESQSEIERAAGDAKFLHEDALVQIMRETESLLNNSSVEIGVFGQVKRGKSTLVNALVGREVSATGMMPKTAVPVTIEYSPEESGLVLFADGSNEFSSIEDAIEATTQADRKRRIKDKLPAVDRVVIRLPLGWLQSGVKLVDTPGLADPAQTDVYENFALAELDRVGAAIFVVSYPPGPELHEVQLISRLASHGLAKIFFVVNTYSDIWKRKGAREEIAEYLTEIIDGASEGAVDFNSDDRRVYVMNLKMATDGIESGSTKKLSESGLLELQTQLEDFLSAGVLDRVTDGAGKRLLRAAAVIEGTLRERVESIKNPGRVTEIRRELETSISASNQALDKITDEVSGSIARLTVELEEVIAHSYANSLASVTSTTDRAKLRDAIARLSVESATTTSVLINKMQRAMLPVIDKARDDLMKSLNVSSWNFTPSDSMGSLLATRDFSEVSVADYIPPHDYSQEAKGAGAILGAILGGGGGIALAATGPVGLLIGGVLGYLFADVLNPWFQGRGNSTEASPAEVQNVVNAVRKAESDARKSLNDAMKKIGTDIRTSLAGVRSNVLRDSQRELQHIEALLSDENSKKRALNEISVFASELAEITGNKIHV